MKRYLQFDLPKIQELALNINNSESFNNHLIKLLYFSIWQLAISQNFDPKNMIRQIIYRYHNSFLPDWIRDIVGDIETDYKGGFTWNEGSIKHNKHGRIVCNSLKWDSFEPETD